MELTLAENELPEDVYRVIAKAIAKHDETEPAVEQAIRDVRGLPCFPLLVDTLVNRSVRRLVHDMRHHRTVVVKRESGVYGRGQKIDYQRSTRVNGVFATLYDMAVAGTTLGVLTGKELPEAADRERNIGNGHLANAALLDRLAPLVKEDKRVRDCVSEKRLRSLWRQVSAKAVENAA